MLKGGCLCGAVRYEIDGPIKHISHCHCAMCRKQHGAAFATYGRVGRQRFRLFGAEAIVAYASTPKVRREFCGRCGSTLFWSHTDRSEGLAVALGTLDDDPVGRPKHHIFVDSKAPWFEITDDLPRFSGDDE